jgi:DNA topoisomerase-1
MNLVIVESPAKGKTIEKYLGPGYKVLASFGHVRDLPVKELGIDVKNNFEPDYVIPTKSKKTVSMLKNEASKAEIVYLATDLDREGEAISWHLVEALGLNSKKSKIKKENIRRITFHEITKNAIAEAIKSPRDLDMNLVNAQQARRVLDRLVGYKLSPFLWKKIAKGLSAGRVQSVAVRLIVEREREILAFKPVEFWRLVAHLFKDKADSSFAADLNSVDGQRVDKLFVKDEKQAKKIEKDLEKAEYKISDITKTEVFRNPSAPFTTSTLQMEAARKLGYSAKQTMVLAQHLYEDGLITYMRTDSLNLSKEAIASQRKVISDKFGAKYLPQIANVYQTKSKGAQEAHEAIRPTDLTLEAAGGDRQESKLYELIWKRTIASGMLPARLEQMDIIIEASGSKLYQFLARGLKQIFDGFTRVYTEGKDDEEIDEENRDLPTLAKGDILKLKELTKEQKFTEPPKRYTEATLVKKLEKEGIGRPSTYAPIMSTIRDRGYVTLENRLFIPSEIGMMVNDVLVDNFPEVVDLKFTARIEDDFDDIAMGKTEWQPVIKEFYEPFAKNLLARDKEVNKADLLGSPDEKCPECGKPLVYRMSKFGKFIACSDYPECKYSKSMEEDAVDKGEAEAPVESEEKCPKCGKPMMVKKGRFGTFLACSDYPKCKTTMSIPTGIKCPDCKEGDVVTRRTKRGKIFWGCSTYPKCKFASWTKPDGTGSAEK